MFDSSRLSDNIFEVTNGVVTTPCLGVLGGHDVVVIDEENTANNNMQEKYNNLTAAAKQTQLSHTYFQRNFDKLTRGYRYTFHCF